ncbi:MAG: hypothetical protein IIZ63_18990 [Caulobacteraceae bacterium]|nr:hypothetical protein [Caulobacteraceae bacterium]
MTPIAWLAALSPPPVEAEAWIWLGEADGAAAREALARAPASRDDRADAALAREEAGGGRLLRRRLLRALAAARLGAPPEAVRLGRDAAGAPFVAGPRPLFASVSGSGPFAAVAVCDRPVGVDVEAVEDAAALADLEAWCVGEAAAKAAGQGWRLAPEVIRLSPADGSAWGGQVDGREAWGLSRRGPGWVAAGLVLR